MHTKGTKVRQVVPVIEGVVEDAHFNAENGRFRYLVQFTTSSGDTGQKWFDQDEVALVPTGEGQ